MGDVHDWEKFLKEWQVADKIIESILSQFVFNHLRMLQTQKIKLIGFQKVTNGYEGSVLVGESFLSHEKWQRKLLSDFLLQFIFTFYEWLKLKK